MHTNSPLYKDDIASVLSMKDIFQFSGKTMLVTGASGLIGTCLVDSVMEANRQGADIHLIVVDRERLRTESRFAEYLAHPLFRLLPFDVREPFPEDVRFDIGIAGACNASPIDYAAHPVDTALTNLLGTKHILDTARNHGGKVLFCSSIEVYGNAIDNRPFAEDDTGALNLSNARASYPETKRAAEALCQGYRTEYNIHVNVARICRVFGSTFVPGDTKAPAQFLQNAAEGRSIVLKSDGTQFFSWLYLPDCVSAMFAILVRGENGSAYNIADESCNAHLRTFAKLVANAAGVNLVFDSQNETEKRGYSKVTRAVMNASRLKALGWKPTYTLPDGVSRTLSILKEGSFN